MEVVLTGLSGVSPEETFQHEVVLASQSPPTPTTQRPAASQLRREAVAPDWLKITPVPGPEGAPPARCATSWANEEGRSTSDMLRVCCVHRGKTWSSLQKCRMSDLPVLKIHLLCVFALHKHS
jgi:hypothetical protein